MTGSAHRTIRAIAWAALAISAFIGVVALMVQSDNEKTRLEMQRKTDEREGPCQDSAVLLATTAGSPDRHECTNRQHRMRVQVATAPSNEEAAALVFCECDRGGAK